MSNYTKTTNFTAKDSLPSGDSAKVIKGSEFDTEFDAIETASATKADTASPTFTGNVTIPKLTLTGEFIETVYALSGTTPALDPANGTIQTWTLTGNSTPTSSLAAESILLMVADGTSYTITWTTVNPTWVDGAAPALPATGYAVILLWNVGGTVYGLGVGSV